MGASAPYAEIMNISAWLHSFELHRDRTWPSLAIAPFSPGQYKHADLLWSALRMLGQDIEGSVRAICTIGANQLVRPNTDPALRRCTALLIAEKRKMSEALRPALGKGHTQDADLNAPPTILTGALTRIALLERMLFSLSDSPCRQLLAQLAKDERRHAGFVMEAKLSSTSTEDTLEYSTAVQHAHRALFFALGMNPKTFGRRAIQLSRLNQAPKAPSQLIGGFGGIGEFGGRGTNPRAKRALNASRKLRALAE